MTIFTINGWDNNYFQNGEPTNPFHKFCMNSWKRADVDIKVFDYNSPEIKEAKIIYKDWIESAVSRDRKNIAADAMRLYILSLYPNMLYLDTDVYMIQGDWLKQLEQEKNFNVFCKRMFCAIYNGEDLETPKQMLEYYHTADTKHDKDICKNFPNIEKLNTQQQIKHLAGVEMPWVKTYYVDSIEEAELYNGNCLYSANIELYRKLDRNNEKNKYSIKWLLGMPEEDIEELKTYITITKS